MKNISVLLIFVVNLAIGQSVSLVPGSSGFIAIPAVTSLGTCGTADKGKIKYLTTDNKFYFCNGTAWAANAFALPYETTINHSTYYDGGTFKITNTATPNEAVAIHGSVTGTDGFAIRASATNTAAFNTGAVYGTNSSTNNNGFGILGDHSGGGSGVIGGSNAGKGVSGSSYSGIGGYFSSYIGPSLVTGTGNVGINENSPTMKLEIKGTGGLLKLKNENNLAENITSEMYFGVNNYYTGAIKTIGTSNSEARMGLFTYSSPNFIDLDERMSILDDGKVGIGRVAPTGMLDVARGNAADGTALFRGTTHISHFNYFTNEDTYIRGGKAGSKVIINDVSGLGSVGIGLATPNDLLDVNGRARIRHNVNTAGVWMSNSTNSLSSADGAFYGMKTNTEAGIYIGNDWRFYINSSGNMTVGGSVTASCGVLVCSDLRYKKNITSLSNSLDNILKITGVRYDFRKNEFPERNFTDKNQIGFIAQEIEKIFPEMVFTDEKGFKSVDYARLTPVLVEAIKELKLTTNELKNTNENLMNRLNKIEALLSK